MSSVATALWISPARLSGRLRREPSSGADDHADGGVAMGRQGHASGAASARDHPSGLSMRRMVSNSSTATLSTSMNQKTPARSYYHRSHHGAHVEAHRYSPQLLREQTAELAFYALSDATSSIHGESPPPRHRLSSDTDADAGLDSQGKGPSGLGEDEELIHESDQPHASDVILEVSEPVSPASGPPSHPHSAAASVLTEMLRSSPPKDQGIGASRVVRNTGERDWRGGVEHSGRLPWRHEAASVGEHTALLPRRHEGKPRRRPWRWRQDLEGQQNNAGLGWFGGRFKSWWPNQGNMAFFSSLANPKCWTLRENWRPDLMKPITCLPAVILGLLLNVLDALSYGMILFPLGQPVFANLGSDGISMFYVSCIISQLVYSGGGSSFRGGVGSEMIEVVPFFHKMAFTILARVGEDNPKSVLATTILSYSISSVITGLVFFGMGACRLGSLIGFFPRHILIGCIGGVGWFLVATGLEVSARLPGELQYTLPTLKQLFRLDTVFLWLIPLFLAAFLILCQRWIKHALFVPCYFLVIPAIFHLLVAAIPNLHLSQLRRQGWVFDVPTASTPFYHFYSLYDFRAVDWAALGKTVPAMFALTFFGVLHVPINVPALAFSTGEDNVNVDRELIAHGLSNALSGFAGSIQNYLVYTNSLLFIRSGGNSRVAGIMLALGTCGLLVIGPNIIGYIPIMVVGALIFLLGIELLREALFDTWGRVHRLEYLTIVAIVVIMGAWDFVIGIFAGIVLACVNFVVQTSRKSAIRAAYTGEVARSTVRRHPTQYHFLRQVGKQIHVTKLAGYLFFGTIVSVEKQIRAMLEEESFKERPIRFLICDMRHVTGIDFSAAEAFTRINRLLESKKVEMVVCGITPGGEIERSLRSVGLWDDGDGLEQTFEDLNSALEYCENGLLRTLYARTDALSAGHSKFLGMLTHVAGAMYADAAEDVPKLDSSSFPFEANYSSPRRNHLHQVAHQTLHEHDHRSPARWQNFKQPLPLILQTFQSLSDKNEDFWFRACAFFTRTEHVAGTVLFRRGDAATGFYLLELGIFRAEYHLPQGQFSESIVAGTTCGELPFFAGTPRTATVTAERDSIAWLLSAERWEALQKQHPDVAHELLKISLKLTSERMDVITSYVLTTAS